jgi:hypothetical protein
MKRVHKTVCLLFFLNALGTHAQEGSVSLGLHMTDAGGSISYSIGQVAYTEATGANGTVNQGIQQPYLINVIGVSELPGVSLSMIVYPNPVTAIVTLKVDGFLPENLNYSLSDASGKILRNQVVSEAETIIDVEQLATGTYYLQILDQSKPTNQFKIIKNN